MGVMKSLWALRPCASTGWRGNLGVFIFAQADMTVSIAIGVTVSYVFISVSNKVGHVQSLLCPIVSFSYFKMSSAPV